MSHENDEFEVGFPDISAVVADADAENDAADEETEEVAPVAKKAPRKAGKATPKKDVTRKVKVLQSVVINVPTEKNKPNSVEISLNGTVCRIKRDEDVAIKPGYFEVLKDAVATYYQQVEHPDGTVDRIPKNIQAVPYSVKDKNYTFKEVPEGYVLGAFESWAD